LAKGRRKTYATNAYSRAKPDFPLSSYFPAQNWMALAFG